MLRLGESEFVSSGAPVYSSLLTDLYQLTMAVAYWRAGMAEREAVFHLTFRKAPFGSGFTLACGLQTAIDYLQNFHFENEDLAYLRTIKGKDGQRLFPDDFLDYLRALRWTCDLDAVPEGAPVFPHEPLVRVRGPLLQAQLVETALLNFVNFQSLIATKAARICLAADGDPVIEFGLRRAQGPDGGLMASRAAYVGGCSGTSNVLAGRVFGIPVAGTHAHSWVMAFANELESFRAYAAALPGNCIFLVDTYDSLEGVRNAVKVGKELRALGFELAGIRLDSGDLAYLSQRAREILDAGGFEQAAILASNDLDEHVITSLKQQRAAITVWGVGTRLVTADGQPALGGVYKLSAIADDAGRWLPKFKLSEESVKTTTPGILQVRRFSAGVSYVGDAIYDTSREPGRELTIVDVADPIRRKRLGRGQEGKDLLEPVFRGGKCVYTAPRLEEIRASARAQLQQLHPGIKRLLNPHRYPAGLELSLHQEKERLIAAHTGTRPSGGDVPFSQNAIS